MRNLYITGMMGSGKTSLGKAIAHATKLPFVDLDDEIVKREGRSIPEIFAEAGEEGFRACETEALRAVSEGELQVVACGGGTVLRKENISIMRATGMILFNDRPLDHILSDITYEGRPVITGGEEKLRRVYAERYEIYRTNCDVQLDNRYESAPDAAEIVVRMVYPDLY